MALFCWLMVSFLYWVYAKETKITAIETFIADNLAFVTINCSDGTNVYNGTGQMSHPDVKHDEVIMYDIFNNNVAPHAINYSCERPTDLVNLVWNTNYKSTGIYLSRSIAGLEFAVYDALGKKAGVPVVTLLGGDVNKPVQVYAGLDDRSISANESAAIFVKLQKEYNIGAFKVHFAKAMGNNTDVYPNRTQDCIIEMRKQLGPDAKLMGDANGGYTDIEHALPIAKLMAENDFKWFEEPFPWWQYDLHKQLYDMNVIDIALGENEYRMVDGFEYMIKNKVSKYCQPDIGYSGGISHITQITAMAEQMNCTLDPHSPNPSFGDIYTLHFMGLNYSNIAEFMEYPCSKKNGGSFPSNFIYDPPLVVSKDGTLAIPKGPGWGVELKQEIRDAKTHSKIFRI